MEISLPCYQSISFDDIQICRNSCSNPKLYIFPRKFLFSGYDFSVCRRRWKTLFMKITSSSVLQGLKPKPKLKPEPVRINDGEESENRIMDDTRIRKSGVGLCSQIEKLVLCNRFREAFELFEVLEIRGSYKIGVSTYDDLVEACIRLRSTIGLSRSRR